ncbi:MAG: formylglycine-generating enzyme family protein [Candidatus Contendobacter sp.]|nr:formylglycine-generating enzyme family protein [Candidatus Contendobacter sp.]
MRGCHWLMGWVLLGVGWPGMVVGQNVDMEEVRRRAEKYEREAAEEAAKKAPAPKPHPKVEPAPKPKPVPKPAPVVDHDHEAWKAAAECGTAACFEAYLEEYPKGRYARMAKARLKPASERPSPAVPVTAPAVVVSRSSLEPDMVSITGGCFQMGSPESEAGRESDERQHRVCVERFEMGKTEVTQGQWQAVMGSNPSSFQNCADCPVESVSWNDIQDYLGQLNQRTGKTYRLPTEAEWEYACRGGVAGQRYCGGDDLDRLAWYDGNSGDKTHSVGRKAANGFGLYDMSGNVWEWTCSAYDQDYGGAEQKCTDKGTTGPLAVRGGAWYSVPVRVRSAARLGYGPAYRGDTRGFRLARSL